MQGIEMLNRNMINEKPLWAWIILIVCMIFGVLCYALIETVISDVLAIFGVVGIIMFTVVGFIALVYSEPTGRYQYEAIVDENVSIQEVYEKYNVIEQDGKKWILEDKECAE